MQSESQIVQTQDNFDLSKILTHFFKLRDWKERTLCIGLPVSISFMMFVLTGGIFLFLLMNDMIPPTGITALMFLLNMLSVPILLITSMASSGYKIKQGEAFRDGVEIHRLYSIRNFFSRIKHAFILKILFLMYQIIPMCIVVFGYVLLFIASIMGSGDSAPGVILILLGYVVMMTGSIIQTILEFLLYPLVTARYINESNFVDVVDYSKIWLNLRKHTKSVLLIVLVNYLLRSVILPTIYVFLIMFLVVGVIIVPLYLPFAVLAVIIFIPILATGMVYAEHTQGVMIGYLAKTIRNNHE